MQVQSNSVQNFYNNVLHNTNLATRGTQRQANDFAGRLGSVANKDLLMAKEQVKATESNQTELSPSDIYESMTMQESPANHSTSHNVLGVNWTDEKLANLAGIKHGVTVDTTKTINWNATGDQILTAEQMSELRSKYNLEDLSPQDYYDLMSDLTNMNAISAEDIHGMHLKTAPPAGMYPAFSGFGGKSFTSGNIFDAIKDDLSSMSELNDFMMSNDFWLLNPNVNKEQHSAYLNYMQSRTNSMNKLNRIFAGIRG